MSAYYNEIDPFAAQWLRELIKAGHIAPGEVDTRSIENVAADDLGSSVFRTGMMMTNCVGVIDPGYTGEISALFWLEHEPSAKSYEVGDRVAQLVVVPVQEVEFVEVPELSQTERGANGYGSTGR